VRREVPPRLGVRKAKALAEHFSKARVPPVKPPVEDAGRIFQNKVSLLSVVGIGSVLMLN